MQIRWPSGYGEIHCAVNGRISPNVNFNTFNVLERITRGDVKECEVYSDLMYRPWRFYKRTRHFISTHNACRVRPISFDVAVTAAKNPKNLDR